MRRSDEPPGGKLFWALALLGTAILLFGVYGFVHDATRTKPDSSLRYLVGGLLIHDLVIAPAVIAVGFALRRFVSGLYRGPIQAAAALSAVIALFSIPVVGGYGRHPDNPTILYSQHYGRTLVVVLAIVWAVGGLALLRARRRDTAPAPRG